MTGLDISEGSILAGKYRVERLLGQGGMGMVLAAHHLQLDERVAIKLMLPEAAQSAEAVARFVREARAAAKIRSEHVARVSDVGTLENGQPFMVMEYLEGTDLGGLLAQRGRLTVEDATGHLLQAVEAVAEAHALGIVHRDLKPGNLFVTRRRDGSPLVKVLDFGISKVSGPQSGTDSARTKTSALMGSPLYMSPEQMTSSRDVDARSDVWALGVILFELVTGEPPFNGETLPQVCGLVLQGPTPSLLERVPDLPPALEAVIQRCLAKSPAERYPSVAELAHALLPFAPRRAAVSVERISRVLQPNPSEWSEPPPSHEPAPARTGVGTNMGFGATGGTSGMSQRRSHGWLWAGLGVSVLVAGGTAAFLLRTPGVIAEPPSASASESVLVHVAPPAPAPEPVTSVSVSQVASTAPAPSASASSVATVSSPRRSAPPVVARRTTKTQPASSPIQQPPAASAKKTIAVGGRL